MLVQLLPEQISRGWQYIKPAIAKSLPPTVAKSDARMNTILESLIMGKLQCWLMYDEKGGDPLAVSTTALSTDVGTGDKTLLIYSLSSVTDGSISDETWADAMYTLKQYAKSLGCIHIAGYTDVPRIMALINKIGGRTDIIYGKISI